MTWDYRSLGYRDDGRYERALLFTLSTDNGQSFGRQRLIYDPPRKTRRSTHRIPTPTARSVILAGSGT